MKKQQFKAGLASVCLGLVSPMAVFATQAHAVDTTFTARSITDIGKMSATTSWADMVAPINGDTAIFPTSATYQTIDNDISSLSLAKLVFSGESGTVSGKNFTITGNGLTITSGIDAIMTGAGGDHIVGVDVTLGGDSTFKTTGVDSLQVGDIGTVLNLGTNDLTLQADGGTITLAGEIDGSGKLILTGDGTVNMLATAATGFSGAVEISTGVFATTAETEGNIIISGGTLKGTSDLLGTITMSAGKIAPGNSPGCLGTGNLTFTGGSYDVEIEGATQCTQYDSTTVIGTVALGTATTLNVSRLASYVPKVNDTFAIIVNDGTDAVTGTFAGLANGASFTVAGYTYQINYDAGVDGNDVLLLVKATPTTPDTGIGSLMTSPLTAALSALAALGVVGGLKFAEQRRK
jgi:fibronectin-binding autotransporter adhesin